MIPEIFTAGTLFPSSAIREVMFPEAKYTSATRQKHFSSENHASRMAKLGTLRKRARSINISGNMFPRFSRA